MIGYSEFFGPSTFFPSGGGGGNTIVFPPFGGPFSVAPLVAAGVFTPAVLMPLSAPPGTVAMFVEATIITPIPGQVLQLRRVGATDPGDVQSLFAQVLGIPITKMMLVATTTGAFEYLFTGASADARIVAWVTI